MMPDGKNLIFNRNGHIEKIAVKAELPQIIDTGSQGVATTTMEFRRTARKLVISDNSQKDHQSLGLYRANRRGAASAHHAESPSYWHWMVTGWENAGLLSAKEW